MAGDVSNTSFMSDYWNVWKPCDVDGDGAVAPVDALMLINNLNSKGPHQLGGEGEAGTVAENGYVDVNNDGWVTPLDTIMVLNTLNSRGEGADAQVNYRLLAFKPGTDDPITGSLKVGDEFDLERAGDGIVGSRLKCQ